MPAKLIICCSGRPALNGHKRRTFLWSVIHNCFIHEGRELDEKELNAVVESVCKKNYDLRPYVRVAKYSEDAPIPDNAKALADAQAKIAALEAAAAAPKEVTLDAALEAVGRLAPERLRKTNLGRKPNAPQETMEV